MNDLDPRWSDAVRHHADATRPTPEAWATIEERADDEGADDPGRDLRAPGGPARRWLLVAAVLVVAGLAGAVALAGGDDPDEIRAGPTPTTADPAAEDADPAADPTRPPSTEAPRPPGSVLVTGRVLVAESPGHAPAVCAGPSADIGPPICDAALLVGWDWDGVEGEAVEGDARFGFFRITGYYDGVRMTLVDPPVADPDPPEEEDESFAPPCDPPPGGWTVTDPERVGDDDMQAMVAAARGEPDVGEVWIDQSVPVAGGVLTATFTGDLERHRAELEAIWGGALCVAPAPIAGAELRAAHARLREGPPIEVAGIPLRLTTSGPDGRKGVVEVGVLAAPPGTQEALEEALGVPVEVTAELELVS